MTKEQFGVIVKIIRTAYPNQKVFDSTESYDLWYRSLSDLEYKVVDIFIQQWILGNKWPPTIAEIRENCEDPYRKQQREYPLPKTVRRDPNALPYKPYEELNALPERVSLKS